MTTHKDAPLYAWTVAATGGLDPLGIGRPVFMGMEQVLDTSIPEDEVHFVNDKGATVAKIKVALEEKPTQLDLDEFENALGDAQHIKFDIPLPENAPPLPKKPVAKKAPAARKATKKAAAKKATPPIRKQGQ